MEWLLVFSAKYLVYVSLALFVLYALLMRQKRRLLSYTAAVLLGSFALAALAGVLYAHPQPFVLQGVEPLIPHEVDNAFPSDHALAAAALAAAALPFFRPLAYLLGIFALAIGAARVTALLHFPADVLASFAIVIAASLTASRIPLLRRIIFK